MLQQQKQHWLGCIDIKTGATIITVVALLNKVSGIFGVMAFDFSDPLSVIMHLYSVLATVVIAFGLNGLFKDHVPTFRIYVLFYWVDLLVSLLMTALLSVVWFVFTDQSTDLATQGTGADEKELDVAWRMEGLLSVAMLTIMWGVRVYFATVLWRYYHILLHRQHLYPSSNAGSSFGLSSQDDGFDDVEEDLDFMDKLEARRDRYLKVDV